jgi:hypothetical protein
MRLGNLVHQFCYGHFCFRAFLSTRSKPLFLRCVEFSYAFRMISIVGTVFANAFLFSLDAILLAFFDLDVA